VLVLFYLFLVSVFWDWSLKTEDWDPEAEGLGQDVEDWARLDLAAEDADPRVDPRAKDADPRAEDTDPRAKDSDPAKRNP